MTRARLVVNPASGTDLGLALLPAITSRLRTIVDDLDITLTTCAEDARRAGERARLDGCDALYVAGGDGTLNAVMRGLVASGEPPRFPVGIVPVGTGNDFSKALDLGEEPESALETLLARRTVDVDIGTLNGIPFVNSSAGGFVADVSENVTEGLKDVAGKLAYLIGGARALLGSRPFTARVTLMESAPLSPLDVQMFAVSNGRYIGGGHPIAPDALVDDGLLDVIVVARMSVVEFVGVLQEIGAGTFHDRPDVLHFRAPGFDLDFDRKVRVNTDGEVMESNRCEYRVRPCAIPFFCGPRPFTRAAPRKMEPGGRDSAVEP